MLRAIYSDRHHKLHKFMFLLTIQKLSEMCVFVGDTYILDEISTYILALRQGTSCPLVLKTKL